MERLESSGGHKNRLLSEAIKRKTYPVIATQGLTGRAIDTNDAYVFVRGKVLSETSPNRCQLLAMRTPRSAEINKCIAFETNTFGKGCWSQYAFHLLTTKRQNAIDEGSIILGLQELYFRSVCKVSEALSSS